MRLGGILTAAAEILSAFETEGRPIAEILKDWGIGHRFAGSKDRAFIGNVVYDALRLRASLEYRLADNAPQALAQGAAALQGLCALDDLEQALTDDKFAPPPLTEAQIAAWKQADLNEAPLWVQADIPQWCAPYFAQSFGQNWSAEGRALAARPPLDLRVNRLKAARERVRKDLRPLDAEPFALSPWALRIAATQGAGRHPNVQIEAAFQKGRFEVQDCGSQMAARLCAARPGEQILDYCAGGGGKALALAADMENRGQIYAYDADKQRLAPIFARLQRAGARNVQVLSRAEALAPLAGAMDCVVLDAPCSGAGTWRRHPDIKWRLTEEKLAPRLAEQQKVLAAGAPFVKSGGRLVYITCSLLPQENDAQIARFLQENADFALADMRAAWAKALDFSAGDGEAADGAQAQMKSGILPHFTPFGLLLSPLQTQTDGFFVSILEKRG